jgi:integrase
MKNLSDQSSAVLHENKVITLKPYEIFVDFAAMASRLKMSLEDCKKNVDLLGSLGQIRYRPLDETSYVVRHEKVRFPIDSSRTPPVTDKTITVSEWVKMDLKAVAENFSPKYIEMTKHVLENFEMNVGSSRLLVEVKKNDYDDFIDSLKSRPNKKKDGQISNTSINNYCRALKSSIRRALKLELIGSDPFRGIKPLRESPKTVDIYHQEEIEALGNVGPEWHQNIFKFSLNTGMRSGEVTNLKFCDVDWDRMLLHVQNSESFRPKFGKERDVYLNDVALKILKKCKADRDLEGPNSDYIFVDEKNRRITADRASKFLKGLIRTAGFSEKLTLHALRRTTATRMRQGGTQLNVIQDVLGHSNLKTTMRYLGVEEEEKERAMRNLSFGSKPLNEG